MHGQKLNFQKRDQVLRDDNGLLRISAAILVERDGQKKMVVGAGGSRIKMIGTEALQEDYVPCMALYEE